MVCAPQNNYPETLGKTVIINAPTGEGLLAGGRTPARYAAAHWRCCSAAKCWQCCMPVVSRLLLQPVLFAMNSALLSGCAVFKMIWAMVRPMLDVRTQAKIEVGGRCCFV